MKERLINFVLIAFGMLVNLLAYIMPKTAIKLAVNTFSEVRQPPMKQWQIDWLDTAEQQDYKFREEVIPVYIWPGSGPTIVLVHGWRSNSARWKRYVKLLQEKDLNIVCFDAIGHGNSSGSKYNIFFHSFLTAEICKKFDAKYLIGHSAGGYAAFHALCHNTDLSIERSVHLAPTQSVVKVFDVYFEKVKFNQRARDLFNGEVERLFDDTMDNFSVLNFIHKLKTPALIIHGRDDDVLSHDDSVLLEKANDNISLELTTGSGHRLQTPEIMAQAIDFTLEEELEYKADK